MKKGYAILLITLLVVGLLFWFSTPEEQLTPNPKELLRLKVKNDSLKLVNQKLWTEKIEIELQSDSINDLIHKDQLTIDQLNTRKHEEIRAIDHFDHDELYSFFANYQLKTTRSTD